MSVHVLLEYFVAARPVQSRFGMLLHLTDVHPICMARTLIFSWADELSWLPGSPSFVSWWHGGGSFVQRRLQIEHLHFRLRVFSIRANFWL